MTTATVTPMTTSGEKMNLYFTRESRNNINPDEFRVSIGLAPAECVKRSFKNEKLSRHWVHVVQNSQNLVIFTVSFRRERLRNVPRFQTNLQDYLVFYLLNLLFLPSKFA